MDTHFLTQLERICKKKLNKKKITDADFWVFFLPQKTPLKVLFQKENSFCAWFEMAVAHINDPINILLIYLEHTGCPRKNFLLGFGVLY